VKAFARIACVLFVALLVACGGGESANGAVSAPVQQDARLVLDTMAWDQGDWSD
jgi:hypothetical protein